jgi:hypothetical protein
MVGEGYVLPSGEAVLGVPGRLTVTKEYQVEHGIERSPADTVRG